MTLWDKVKSFFSSSETTLTGSDKLWIGGGLFGIGFLAGYYVGKPAA